MESIKGWNKYMQDTPMLKAGVDILKKINKKKYKAYIVGGSVRDIILGEKMNDVDIATNMPIEELDKLFKTYDIGKSKDFGIVVVKHKGFDFEIAQFRSDGKYIDGRRPESIKVVGTIEDDLERRDFTIGAMAINSKGDIIDKFGGQKDIKNKVLKTVGNPEDRFGEDKLRLMRAARFATRFDMDIEKGTEKAIKKFSKDITQLSQERIRDELLKSAKLGGKKFANYIKLLDKLKILQVILPELSALKYKPHTKDHHPEGVNVFDHIMKALEISNTKDPLIQLGILLHDIGKVITQGLGDKGTFHHTYFRHAEKGVDLVNDIADRLKLSNKEKESILFAVANHMKFHNMLKMRPSKIAKLVNDKNWDVLLSVARADHMCRPDVLQSEFEAVVDRAIEIKNSFGIKKVDLVAKMASGEKIMKITGLKPSPAIGKIKKEVMDWIVDNNIKNQDEVDKKIEQYI